MQSLTHMMNQRILGRRYPLNKSSSTWLEIGISIVPKPTVRIALINRRNQQVIFSEEAWYELQNKKDSIMCHYDNQKPNASHAEEKLDNVTAYFGQVHNNNAVSFHGSDGEEVIILRETCENLYNMHHSILNVIQYLDEKLDAVNLKLKIFKNIVKNLSNTDNDKQKAYDAILSDKRYNKQSIVDSELLALGIDGILWGAAQL